MRGTNEHLTVEEIEQLTAPAADFASGALEGAMRHLDSCEQCRFRMLFAQNSADGDFGQSPVAGSPSSQAQDDPPGCLEESRWLELAAGVVPKEDRMRYLEHAATCSHCGPLLKAAIQDVGTELTPEEETKVASLSSANPAWQESLVARITGAPVPQAEAKRDVLRKTFAFWPRWAFASAVAVLATVAGWWGWVQFRAPSVDSLLAQAYTEQRTIEMRIPGAKYAPMRVERGANGSNLDKPPALLKAEALISEHLRKSPSDPAWLQAKARADLLEFNYDSAIETLQRVLDLQPDSTEAMTDLATAYFQRAEANNDREIDYGIALEYLGRALSRSPDNVVVLFNRVIIERRLHLYLPAADDCQHYLRIESSGDWAAEVKRQLEEFKEKISTKESLLNQPLLTTKEVGALADTHNSAEQLDARVEDYVHAAIKEWLPIAFSDSAPSPEAKGALNALSALATVTQDRHNDSWLADVLRDSHGANFAAAVAALAAAVQANDRGDYEKGRASAHDAVSRFAAAGNSAGALRAEEEEAYSDHLRYDGVECMKLVRELNKQLDHRGYQWLLAQTDLEESNCESMLGDFSTNALKRGTAIAADHRYTALSLRGLGFLAVLAGYTGDTQQDFSLASKGLELFWSSQVDVIKGYNFYTHLDKAADLLRLPYLQVALWRQATALADLHPDLVQRAMAHSWFANSAYLAHMPDLAASEFAKASLFFQQAPAKDATRGRLDAETRLANLETRQGDLQQAADRLRQIQANLGQTPSFGIAIGFYSAQAELILRQNSSADDSAVTAAVFLAEWALQHLHGENTRNRWAKQTSQAYRNLVAWKLREGNVSGALETWEWYKGAAFRSQQEPSESPDIDLNSAVSPDVHSSTSLDVPSVVSQQLPKLNKETVIAYAALPDALSAWVYDDRGIFHYSLDAPAGEIEKRVAQFKRLCATHDSDLKTLRSIGRELYGLLIDPLEDRLVPGRTLVIEPDGILSAIPMEALVDRKGRYLVEREPVVITAGLYESLRARADAGISAETPALVVVAPSPAQEGFVPAPDALLEARTVTEKFRAAELLKNQEADLAAIRRKMSNVAVFHFVGHALALQERSGLLLAERDSHTQRARLINAQSLGPEVIRNLQLAVLSACSTGLPVSLGATGTESLAEYLLSMGVPHVVASRWDVDSTSTSIFMRGFYSNLLSGDSVATALRTAQLTVLSQPNWSHPYYWAAFGLQGS